MEYSIDQRPGKTLIKFSARAPEQVMNMLKKSEQCSYSGYFNKTWTCTGVSPDFIQELKNKLNRLNWVQVKNATPGRVELKLKIDNDGGDDIKLIFNTKPYGPFGNNLAKIASVDSKEKRWWYVRNENDQISELRTLISQYPNVAVEGLENLQSKKMHAVQESSSIVSSSTHTGTPVTFHVNSENNAVTLSFPDGLPTAIKLSQLRGALQLLGYYVEENANVEVDVDANEVEVDVL